MSVPPPVIAVAASLSLVGLFVRLISIIVVPARVTVLFTVSVLIEGLGAKILPTCTVTAPLIIPLPPSVPPLATLTPPEPVPLPDVLFRDCLDTQVRNC